MLLWRYVKIPYDFYSGMDYADYAVAISLEQP